MSNDDFFTAVTDAFVDKLDDLEDADKLGNFEIQNLMASFNEAASVASNVERKSDDTGKSVISKI